MKKFLSCILMVIMIASSVFFASAYTGGEPTIDDYLNWIPGAVQSINEYKIDDPQNPNNDFYQNMNIAQEARQLASWLNSLGNKFPQSGRKVDDELISMLVGAKYAIEGIDIPAVTKVAEALSAVEAKLGIFYEKAGNHVQSDALKGFSDIEKYDWAKEAIVDMSVGNYKGLFGGTTTPDASGMALFSPNNKMTRAEFIAVVTRLLFPQELSDMQVIKDGVWYKNNYRVALSHNIIPKSEYALEDEVLNAPIPRQEMAWILYRACWTLEENIQEGVSSSKIADYDTIDEEYRKKVRQVYEMGLLTGVDDKGSFAPHQTLTRAEAATVLYRLVNPLKRANRNGTTVVLPEGEFYVEKIGGIPDNLEKVGQ